VPHAGLAVPHAGLVVPHAGLVDHAAPAELNAARVRLGAKAALGATEKAGQAVSAAIRGAVQEHQAIDPVVIGPVLAHRSQVDPRQVHHALVALPAVARVAPLARDRDLVSKIDPAAPLIRPVAVRAVLVPRDR